jgi:HlyD family secretion protein
MTGRKFIVVIGMVFLIALVVYFATTPKGSDIPLIGVVDGNEVIVSPQITGRIVNLTVDEGSQVKKGDLIAELDRTELEASLAAAKANVGTLENSVTQAQHNYSWTSDQTSASLDQAQAMTTSSDAQLEQAKAQLWRDQSDLKRMQLLYDKHEVSGQDRDHAEAAVRMSEANVRALEDAV